jgi:hypothetical protein
MLQKAAQANAMQAMALNIHMHKNNSTGRIAAPKEE